MARRTVKVGDTIMFPDRSGQVDRQTPVVLDMSPHEEANFVRLRVTLSVRPINYYDSDGQPMRFSIGYRYAHFALALDNGSITVPDVSEEKLHFEKRSGRDVEHGFEIKPKLEIKASTSEAGVGGELGGYQRKVIAKSGVIVSGEGDSPRLRQDLRPDVGVVYWTIHPSPFAPRAPLRLSHTVEVECRWPGERLGEISLFARNRIHCHEDEATGAQALFARFILWSAGCNPLNDARPQTFQILRSAA